MSRKPRKPRLRIRLVAWFKAASKRQPSRLCAADIELYCAWALRLPSEERRRRLLAGDRASHPDVAQALSRKSYALRLTHPREALRFAEAAVDVAECVTMPEHCRSILMDIRAEAWGHLANSLRACRRLDEAARAWVKVDEHLQHGTDDARLRAQLDLLRAGLWCEHRDFERAIPLLKRTVENLAQAGEPDLLSESHVGLAVALDQAGRSEEALEVNGEAIKALDQARNPELVFRVLHNSLICLESTGQESEALAGLKVAENIYRVFATPEIKVRYHWMRGRLYNAHQEWRAAIADLEVAKRDFLARGLEYDACFVSLELALAYAHLSDLGRVRDLAGEMMPVFESRRLPNEAAAVLLTFARAAENLRLSSGQLAELAARLRPLRMAYERAEVGAEEAA